MRINCWGALLWLSYIHRIVSAARLHVTSARTSSVHRTRSVRHEPAVMFPLERKTLTAASCVNVCSMFRIEFRGLFPSAGVHYEFSEPPSQIYDAHIPSQTLVRVGRRSRRQQRQRRRQKKCVTASCFRFRNLALVLFSMRLRVSMAVPILYVFFTLTPMHM